MIERIPIERYDVRLAELEAEFVRVHGSKVLFYASDKWIVAEREGSATVRLEFFNNEEDCGC
jgi:hypothetical protein